MCNNSRVLTELKNTKIVNAAGVYSSTIDSLEDWIKAGVDGIVLKTSTHKPRKDYEFPNVAIDGERIVQAVGLPNPGYRYMGKIAKDIRENYPQIFIINSFTSANKTEIEEIVSHLIKNCDAIEYNISCPHAKGLGSSIGYDFVFLKEVCDLIRDLCPKSFGLKMPYYPTDELLEKCIKSSKNVDFYTCINSR